MTRIYNEITPLEENRLFFAKHTPDEPMDFPLHFHSDYEITLVRNVRGQRIVGNSVEAIDGKDLVLIGPDTVHGYKWDPGYRTGEVTVVQFSREFKSFQLIGKSELEPIFRMLSFLKSGICFSRQVTDSLEDRIIGLHELEGIRGVLSFLEILYELSVDVNGRSIGTIADDGRSLESGRINRILKYVEKNYMNDISLSDIGRVAGMSESAVCRYFRKQTAVRFSDYLNNFRIDKVIRQMLKSDDYISNICFECGFSNISNFNRAFRRRLGMSPREYRNKLRQSAIFNGEK